MLRVEIGALARGSAEISGTMAADDPLFEALGVELARPVSVSGRMTSASMGRFYWHGQIVTRATGRCRRCLTETALPIDVRVEVVFTQDQDAEDPSEYVLPENTHAIDVREAVREELILTLPESLLCRGDCRGLCPSCGADLNVEPCECTAPADPRWGALEELRTKANE